MIGIINKLLDRFGLAYRSTARAVENSLCAAGSALRMLWQAIRFMRRAPFRRRTIMREMWIIGVQSLPLAFFFLFLIGMVFALQSGYFMTDYGQESLLGRLMGASMVRELGPWMTLIVLVARNGSSMAAEIGTMVVSEEISALRIMAVDPVDYIVMPRILAFITIVPALTILSTGVGMYGGLVVASLQFRVPAYTYVDELLLGMEPALAVYWAVFKAFVFSVIAATVACSCGLRTKGGALGVGKASRDAVVSSLILIVLFNFVLSSFFQVVRTLMENAGS